MRTLWQDLRYGARMLKKKPGFTIVAILTLALGIGANTAIFSVVDAVLLRPLPFPNPEQIVLVRDDLTGRQLEDVGMSVDELRDFQERSDVFEQISAVWPVDANLTGSDRPERIELLGVSPNYFSLLGANAQLGRVFGPQDRALGFAEGVVISDGLWRRLFGADPNILGRKARLDTDIYTIIGVMPPGFRHPARTLRNEVEMWATAGYAADPFGPPVRANRMLPGAIARLKPGMSVQQAQFKLDSFVANLRGQFPNDYPADAGWSVRLIPVREKLVGNVRTTLWALMGAVGLALLIGCVNIANLLLARSLARRREMAIRLALGAGRGRLILQLLVESLLLALLGGAVALLLAVWSMELLLRFAPVDIPRLHEVGVNGGVLGFTFAISILTGVIFGLVPALQASRPDMTPNLKEGGQSAGASSQRFRSALVVIELALSLSLMAGAGLLTRSFWRLLQVDPGFDPRNVVMARIWLPVPNNPSLDPYRPREKRAAFVREVLRRVSALPGAQYAAVGSGNSVPLIGPHDSAMFAIESQAAADSNPPRAQVSDVSPDYFRALGAPLVRGRFFAEGDDVQTPQVALVDEATASRYWPNEDPIGSRIKFGHRGSNRPWVTIVGVVGNIKTNGLDQPDQPHIYVPILQYPGYAMAVYIRAEADGDGFATPASLAALTPSLRREVQAVDPDLPTFGERKMEDLISASLAQRRFAARLISMFGGLALLLSGIGIYGVIAWSVNQRTREIGIRLALGASTRAILRWTLWHGMRLTLIGVAVGLLGAVATTRLLRGLLFEVALTDPLTYTGVAALLTVVALAACWIPARRATKVDPMVALRSE